MKHVASLGLLVLLAGSFTACKKDSDSPKSKTDLLTAKNWRMSAAVVTYTSQGTTISQDQYADMEPCEKDDFFRFNTDKTLTIDQGPTKCPDTAGDPQTEKGSWDFNSDQTKLLLSESSGGVSIGFDIKELTSSTMKLQITDDDNGDVLTYSVTYSSF